ncbi:MAG TPA: hypothetical protein VKK81_15075 [Candidatus Binatia bacterium]|nr:hypothetical protein [Candidatus Binatia bacterium]
MARREKVKEVPVSYIRKVRLVEKTCPVCGKKFEGVKIRKFCSRSCQNKADYGRHGEEYRQARMENYRRQKEQVSKR